MAKSPQTSDAVVICGGKRHFPSGVRPGLELIEELRFVM
jgi:hypothetical protein